jgi:hypothetical protein
LAFGLAFVVSKPHDPPSPRLWQDRPTREREREYLDKTPAIKNIEVAIALCLEVRAERGLPLTVETRLVEVLV